jgi:hypothetical protein
MAELRLPVLVEYVLTKDACEAHARLLNGDSRKWLREHHKVTATMFLFLSLTGLFAAASPSEVGLWLVIAAGSMAIGRQLWKEYKSALQVLDNAIERGVGKCVRTEINDRGFLEHDQGVESFCPWSAMKSYCTRDNVLMIELANGLWSVTPAATLKPESVTLQDLEGILFKHGVSQRR